MISPTDDSTPSYTFFGDSGSINYHGSCRSDVKESKFPYLTTIDFDHLPDGVYNDCYITLTMADGRVTEPLWVTPFVIDTSGASLADLSGGAYKVANAKSRLCLVSENGNVKLDYCGADNLWHVVSTVSGDFNLVWAPDGTCLDFAGDDIADGSDSKNAITAPCNGFDSQEFNASRPPYGDNIYLSIYDTRAIIAKLVPPSANYINTGCLNTEGGSLEPGANVIFGFDCPDLKDDQVWALTPYKPIDAPKGLSDFIHRASGSKLVSQGDSVELLRSSHIKGSPWSVIVSPNGLQLKSTQNGNCLDWSDRRVGAESGGVYTTTKPCAESATQYFEPANPGVESASADNLALILRSKVLLPNGAPGCLDIDAEYYNRGGKLIVGSCHERESQIFKLQKISEPEAPENNLQKLLTSLRDPNDGKVMVVAHRGCWSNAPENSAQAIKDCIDIGADMVEIDVRLTRDGIPVLMHDSALHRTTTGSGNVADKTLAELKQLYLREGGGGARARATSHRPPTLEEALLVAKDKILVNLDVKAEYFDEAFEVVEKIGVSSQIIMKSGKAANDPTLRSSAFLGKVHYMPIIYPNRARALGDIAADYLSYDPVAFEVIYSDASLLRAGYSSITRLNKRLWVNSLGGNLCGGCNEDGDTPAQVWGSLLDMDVNMIQTDYPARLLEYLKSIDKHN